MNSKGRAWAYRLVNRSCCYMAAISRWRGWVTRALLSHCASRYSLPMLEKVRQKHRELYNRIFGYGIVGILGFMKPDQLTAHAQIESAGRDICILSFNHDGTRG